MLQRIQTVHLLSAAALLGIFLGLGEAWGRAAAEAAWLAEYAVPVGYALAGLAAALTLIALFLYKNRSAQAKVIRAAQVADLLLVIVLLVAVALAVFESETPLTSEYAVRASAVLLPVAAYVFLNLARRGVRRDTELVRSMDRLR